MLGAEFVRAGNSNTYACKGVYVSPNYIKGLLKGKSFYTSGCCYPLSSLIRTFKYWERGFIKHPYDVIFHILADMLERGYRTEKDWKDQLSAIDVSRRDMKKLRKNTDALKIIFKELHKPEGKCYDSGRLPY